MHRSCGQRVFGDLKSIDRNPMIAVVMREGTLYMTEEEWLASDDPTTMVDFMLRRLSAWQLVTASIALPHRR